MSIKPSKQNGSSKKEEAQVWRVRPLEHFHEDQASVESQAEEYDFQGEARKLCDDAKKAWETLNNTDVSVIDKFLECAAEKIEAACDSLIRINEQEVELSKSKGMQEFMLNRMELNEQRVESMANALRSIAQMPSTLWQTTEPKEQASGLKISQMRVPIGVIGIIYESRPHVTADAAAISLKAGNASILRGGSECYKTSMAIGEILHTALEEVGLPKNLIQVVPTSDRRAVRALITQSKGLDLIIPRGGASLVAAIVEQSSVPVLKHLSGNCHIYIDSDADMKMAIDVVVNAKCYRPAICGTVETVLVHSAVEWVVPELITALKNEEVIVRGCSKTRALVSAVEKATQEDWHTEYLDKIVALKIVDDLDSAIGHISQYSSQHTESIITQNAANAEKFQRLVDSGSVMWNVPTCYADGGEYGLGAEIGISTDKLHARGPVGVEGLTTFKYIVLGDGQLRQ